MYEGSIEDVLASGEYDQGDMALVTYDELADLVEQAKSITRLFHDCMRDNDAYQSIISNFERTKWNRPLHPTLGGKSPYSEFLLPL